MERDELLHELESLAQLDTDAVRVYDEAIKHADEEDVRTNFERFQGEHRYHGQQLSVEITRLGGKLPVMKVDLAGRLAEWITAIRSVRGTEGALHAMRTAEKYHNRRYNEAAGWDTSDEGVSTLLRQFDDDEKRHLAYIEERLGTTVTAGRM